MGEMIVAHDISHGLKANQQITADGLRRRVTPIVEALLEGFTPGQHHPRRINRGGTCG